MQKYRYYLPPRSKLPFAAGILAGLMTLNTIYTLISMPYYTHYWDYWATMVSGILLCGFCFLFRNRHAEPTLIPAAMLALIACITPNLIHWVGLQPDCPGRGCRQQRHGAFFQQRLGGRVRAAPGSKVPRRLCKVDALRLFQPQRHTWPNAHLPALLYKNKE